MKECNCKCHKENAESELKKCKEHNKKKTEEIIHLKKKVFAMTIAIAVVVGVVSKESLDKVIEYFQTYDKVKQAIDNSISITDEQLSNTVDNGFAGVSVLPSPSTLGIFALTALCPTKRRR
ncbi:MAG: hypothetical protein Unbinned4614contig1000_19 [Prokaryotic dsDNA virus sp.]|nr:MAG: hypothetical protein Unbinned4614contig1000_19 [Prokaryotic dsDNA virus sp.]|tara:strand:- start:1345 stop:1707 length:363 start_codon:yes stop_codon:yes gene_type:complete